MSSKGKVVSVRVKDVKNIELAPGLADALTASLDGSYLEYLTLMSRAQVLNRMTTLIKLTAPDGDVYVNPHLVLYVMF